MIRSWNIIVHYPEQKNISFFSWNLWLGDAPISSINTLMFYTKDDFIDITYVAYI